MRNMFGKEPSINNNKLYLIVLLNLIKINYKIKFYAK